MFGMRDGVVVRRREVVDLKTSWGVNYEFLPVLISEMGR